MTDNDPTLRKLPKLRTPDTFILETTEQSARPDMLAIQFPGIGKVLVSVPIGAELLLGRFEISDMGPLCLNLVPFRAIEQGVSRRHAKVKHTESGWWVEDTGSSNGTWLDGEQLTPFDARCVQANSHLLLAQMECYLILPTGRRIMRKLAHP